jgi:hypothetical protein
MNQNRAALVAIVVAVPPAMIATQFGRHWSSAKKMSDAE